MSPLSFGTAPLVVCSSVTCRRGVDCEVGVGTPASSCLSGLEQGEALVGVAACKRLANPSARARELSSGSAALPSAILTAVPCERREAASNRHRFATRVAERHDRGDRRPHAHLCPGLAGLSGSLWWRPVAAARGRSGRGRTALARRGLPPASPATSLTPPAP